MNLLSFPSFAEVGGAASYTTDQLTELTAVEAVELLCTKKISAVQYASALLTRAEEIDCLNTYASLDQARVSFDANREINHILYTPCRG